MTDYYCGVCHQPITGADIEDRHTLPDGEDCHEACCPECNARDAVWSYMWLTEEDEVSE